MLHWLQLSIPRNVLFFIELTIVSVLFHSLVMLFFCFYSWYHDVSYAIILTTTEVELRDLTMSPCAFMPQKSFVKASATMPAQKKVAPVRKKTSLSHTVSSPLPEKKIPEKKAPLEKKTQPMPPKVPVQKKQENKTREKALAQKENIAPSTPLKVTEQEYDALMMQQLLQEELALHWQPPDGLSHDLSCEVKVALDNRGGVKKVDIIKASGVLVYDIHAQSTMMTLCYPPSAWNKEITITLKQT